jgi:hypothetical protein
MFCQALKPQSVKAKNSSRQKKQLEFALQKELEVATPLIIVERTAYIELSAQVHFADKLCVLVSKEDH